jgi:hypothetical protein
LPSLVSCFLRVWQGLFALKLALRKFKTTSTDFHTDLELSAEIHATPHLEAVINVAREGVWPEKGEVTRGWRKLHNEELHDL